ncbi:MAG: hypothetical protein DWQ40_08445, partial [Actinobacteria bacterium]
MTPDGSPGPRGTEEDLSFTYDLDDRGERAAPKRTIDAWTVVTGILGGVLLGTGVTFAVLGLTGVFTEPTSPTLPPAPTL